VENEQHDQYLAGGIRRGRRGSRRRHLARQAGRRRHCAAGAEQVSLSSDAAAGTQLLDAARNAEGVDPATIQKVKTAIQNGTYDVSPDKLAQSIIGAMKEMT